MLAWRHLTGFLNETRTHSSTPAEKTAFESSGFDSLDEAVALIEQLPPGRVLPDDTSL